MMASPMYGNAILKEDLTTYKRRRVCFIVKKALVSNRKTPTTVSETSVRLDSKSNFIDDPVVSPAQKKVPMVRPDLRLNVVSVLKRSAL